MVEEDRMHVQWFGYVGLRTARLDDWSGYATGFLGLQLAERSAGGIDVPHG